MIEVVDYVKHIKSVYSAEGDPTRAEGQMRYMRNKFAYYGLKAPEWVALLKGIFRDYGLYEGKDLYYFVRLCFEDEYREVHYAGLQMLEKRIRKMPEPAIDFLEECIFTQSWWDTVDWINKLVGIHFKRYPALQRKYADKWIESDNIWLQRVAIIHQLTYKDNADWELMQRMILRRVDSDEFFVQKAAGWALRQYSKFNSDAVTGFIDDHPELPNLTKREGLKWLMRKVDISK